MAANARTVSCGTTCLWGGFLNFIGRIGWGLVISALLLLVVWLISPQLGLRTLTEAGHSLLTLSPYFIASFVLAGYAKAASMDLLVTRAFRGNVTLMILLSTGVAVLTPLCSCSVVALIAVLLRAGVPLSAVMAFWMASPVISPDLYIFTWGVLGVEIATARFLSAVFMALVGGYLTLLLENWGLFKSPLRSGFEVRQVPLGDAVDPVWRFWREPERREVFVKEFLLAARFILPWMVLAFLLESLISSQIPAEVVANWIGQGNAWAIPTAVLVSIPTYINGVSAVPVVGGLMALGMTKPAALAYIVVGSITTVPAIMAVLPLVKLRVFFWHLFLGLGLGIVASYVYQAYLFFV
jgi:uncharacterized membrane protein YraQ (UPF0718 family)